MDELSQPLEDRKFEKGFVLFGAITSLIIGIIVLLFFISKVSDSYSIPKAGETLNFTHWGAFGDFIAGVVGTFFSLAGFFLLYLTLKDQRENFHKERLESNFFELIKFHRENVSELSYSHNEELAEKRKVFKVVFSEFKEAWSELKPAFAKYSVNQIYNESYLKQLEVNPQIVSRNINLKEFAQVDIVFLIVFIGLSGEDKTIIQNLCLNRYDVEFVQEIIDLASMKPKKKSTYWGRWTAISNNLQNKKDILDYRKANPKLNSPTNEILFGTNKLNSFYPNKYEKYYGGHQFRLGHYFRNLFQTVKFINEEKYLTKDEKYRYIKILRGQLSNYEQLILFLNSLSEIGRTWELVNKKNTSVKIENEKQLITKYNLIKNIPIKSISGEIELKNYYPNVKYEALL